MAELAISASALILILLLLRAVFGGKISRRFQYALWLLVLVRLLVPVSFGQSAASAANLVRSEPDGTVYAGPVYRGPLQGGVTAAAGTIADANSFGYAVPEGGGNMTRYAVKWSVSGVLAVVWKIGMALVALWFLTLNALFLGRLHRTREKLDCECRLPVYTAQKLPSACLFGLLRPAVYVTPEAAREPETLKHILLHESTHYRHGDHIWSLLRAACLVVWWWNPLVWAAAAVSRRDCELACDESVVRILGAENRAAYGQTLLRLVNGERQPGSMLYTATTMTGGGKQLKARIEAIARRVKPRKIVVILALVLAALAVGCTFTGAARNAGGAGSPDSAGMTGGTDGPTQVPVTGADNSETGAADAQGSIGIIGGADGPTKVFVTGMDSQDYEGLFQQLAADPDNEEIRQQLLDGGQATALWCFRYLVDHPDCLDGLGDSDQSKPSLILNTAAELLGGDDLSVAVQTQSALWDAYVQFAQKTYPAGSSLPKESGQQLYYYLARMLDPSDVSQTASAETGVTHLLDSDLVTADGVALGMDYDSVLALTGTPDETYPDQEGVKSFMKGHVLYGFYTDSEGVYRLLGYSSDTKSGVMPLGIKVGDSLPDVLAIFGAEETPLRQRAQETIYGTPGEMDSAFLNYNTDLGSYTLNLFAQSSGLTVSFDRSNKVWTVGCWSNRIYQ